MRSFISKLLSFSVAVLMSAQGGVPAYAQTTQLLQATQVDEILNLAKGFGSASLTTSDEGDPKIAARMEGLAYSIYFLECENHKDCKSLQFHSGFEFKDSKPSEAKILQWNYDNRWARSFLNKRGAAIQMDIPMRFGIARETLDDSLRIWGTLMKKFVQFTGFK